MNKKILIPIIAVIIIAIGLSLWFFVFNKPKEQAEVVKPSECENRKVLERAVYSDALVATIEECNDETQKYNIIVVKNNGIEEKIVQIALKDAGSDKPFFGFKNIKFLNEKYVTYKAMRWKGYSVNIYEPDTKEDVILGYGLQIEKMIGGKYFFTYGWSELDGDRQLRVYSLTDGKMVEDLGAKAYYNTCVGDNGMIICTELNKHKQYYWMKGTSAMTFEAGDSALEITPDGNSRIRKDNDDGTFDIYLASRGKAVFYGKFSRELYTDNDLVNNGSYYIVKSVGDYNYLFRFNTRKEMKQLYSTPYSLPFFVSNDGKYVAATVYMRVGSSNSETLVLIDSNGTIKKTATDKDLFNKTVDSIGIAQWAADALWVEVVTSTGSLSAIASINLKDFSIKSYNIEGIASSKERVLNSEKELIALSDYGNLYVYDLNKSEQTLIATSLGKAFNPKWVDQSTLEYTENGQRVTKTGF